MSQIHQYAKPTMRESKNQTPIIKAVMSKFNIAKEVHGLTIRDPE